MVLLNKTSENLKNELIGTFLSLDWKLELRWQPIYSVFGDQFWTHGNWPSLQDPSKGQIQQFKDQNGNRNIDLVENAAWNRRRFHTGLQSWRCEIRILHCLWHGKIMNGCRQISFRAAKNRKKILLVEARQSIFLAASITTVPETWKVWHFEEHKSNWKHGNRIILL